jgi:SAM-dependent methyltransferase
MSTSAFFDEHAPVYDELRPQNGAWWRRFDALVREGDLRGRRVLDVGCGTGALASALSDRAQARVWAVEPSAEMLAVARARAPRGVGLKQADAEDLPFKDGWFERVVMSLVVHLVDRRRALAEAHRVLAPEGRLVIATFDHAHFDAWWAARLFPSIAEIDRMRFPTRAQLAEELREAGFVEAREIALPDEERIPRAEALRRLHGRHISTFSLLPPDEVRVGIERAERELPDPVVVRLEQLIVVATR